MNFPADQAPHQYGDAREKADAPEVEEWLRTGQVAALFRVHPRTVIRWAAAGLLPYVVTLGGQRRFPAAGVQALLARRRQLPEEPGGLLRTGEVARRLRVDPRTVARWNRQGRLASIRTLGGHRRYPQAAVDRLLAQPGDAPPCSQFEMNNNGATVPAAEVAQPPQAGPESART